MSNLWEPFSERDVDLSGHYLIVANDVAYEYEAKDFADALAQYRAAGYHEKYVVAVMRTGPLRAAADD